MKVRLLLVLAAVSLLAIPSVSLAQAPNLGAASNFALFTATGAVTNVGSSTVIGDIGTNTGDISGFETATLIGNPPYIALSPESILAAGAVISAYNSLSSATCGPLIDPQLGGQTLTPGTYCQNTATATSLDGILTLSGSGVYIIKLNSALTTGTSSSIVLTNGATANNVFFQVMGAATLGTGSTFRGTIVAMGAIVLNTTTLEGRALSTVGAITVNESRVITPVLAPLPVDLTLVSRVRPSTVYGTTAITAVVNVYELLNAATSGPITIKIPKDPQYTLSLNPAATLVNGLLVQNSVWTFSGPSGGFYTLTTNQVIAGNVGTGALAFGLEGTLTPGASGGTLTFSSIIVGGSGGETRIDNNNDADTVDYFQN